MESASATGQYNGGMGGATTMGESIDFPPPPRRVRARARGYGCGLIAVRLFILPHTLAGFALIGWLLITILWLIAGRDVQGNVLAARSGVTSKGNTYYEIEYEYDSGTKVRRDKTSASEKYYLSLPPSLRDGKPTSEPVPIVVRVFEVGSVHHAIALAGQSLIGHVAGIVFAAAFWNTILSVFLYQIYVRPIMMHVLARFGVAVLGRVMSIRETKGRGPTHVLEYEFQTTSGEHRRAKISLTTGAARRARVGEAVTVLYLAWWPWWSCVYECGDFDIDGAPVDSPVRKRSWSGAA
ncbi:MAG TPA: hypothetical protein VH518_09280 [Tepidisphaeraceae bacterium]|jgi:hypothetical protein